MNTCHSFIDRMIRDPRFRLGGDRRYGDRLEEARGHMRSSHLWSEYFNTLNFRHRIVRMVILIATNDPNNPTVQSYDLDTLCGRTQKKLMKREEVCTQPVDDKPKNPMGEQNTGSLELDVKLRFDWQCSPDDTRALSQDRDGVIPFSLGASPTG